ncbi:sporulation peptidase YabG [Aneurinibacillus sp. Ricciae_BoGa-3]|uniref:sporulation peptidase YabG n=1 Tax=Aneurinibacillus sp. Ricciae_BoGa-3 TaxID=3022697 RepID=UPI0023413FA2|nr:sporulation peptidase YabG [Aneurinibacillus sp. Ricciae_BoGa-3]WCK54621.1 sporulation peptidase YabG [Aneurinibacillus sp. Ricciae_BoGa-3]
MVHFKVGDVVARKSYGQDMLFQIIEMHPETGSAFLLGFEYRLLADAPLSDLVKLDPHEVETRTQKYRQRAQEAVRLIQQDRNRMRDRSEWRLVNHSEEVGGSFDWPGRVLHLDGDSTYLKRCLQVYEELKIPVDGYYMAEKDMPNRVTELLQKHRPDILVITGHDALQAKRGPANNLDSYRNSRYFIQAVEKARLYEPGKDNLVIFAGACQSFFEAILLSGANFASSPKRINIHTLDPVYIAEKIAYTSIRQSVNIFDMIKNTITGLDGVGGLETKGCFRFGIPKQ